MKRALDDISSSVYIFFMQKRNFKKDAYYHIYNRGCNKQRLFFCEKDFGRYWNTILRYLEKFPHIRIHVWNLLPNHFHFLLSEVADSKNPRNSSSNSKSSNSEEEAEEISKFMQKIQQAYARFFTIKHGDSVNQGKKAPVFEGRFKDKIITDEEYLAQVAYYIRHNAVKHGIVEKVEDWPWAGSTESEDFPAMDYTGIDDEFDPGFD